MNFSISKTAIFCVTISLAACSSDEGTGDDGDPSGGGDANGSGGDTDGSGGGGDANSSGGADGGGGGGDTDGSGGNANTGGSSAGTGGKNQIDPPTTCMTPPTVGEACNEDIPECQCAGGDYIQCRQVGNTNEQVCVDETPQAGILGQACTKDYECASTYCYPDVKDGDATCHKSCLPTGATNANTPSDCCHNGTAGGFCT